MGLFKKKKEEEEEEDKRMLIRLNLLVNCHLLRNASFGYFFFFICLFFYFMVCRTNVRSFTAISD